MKNTAAIGWTLCLILAGLLLGACSSGEADQTMVGPQGPPGPIGPVGPPGEDATAAQEYVGSRRCSQCHVEESQKFERSGHPFSLSAVRNSEPPEFPSDSKTGGVPGSPEGTSWSEIRFVVGGYAWKAVFVGADGYLVAAEDGSPAAFAFANELLETRKFWTTSHPGQSLAFDCGTCHATGYRPQGHQDGLEGVVGTWEFAGVQCEACHGPGSLHASNPYGYSMILDRSAQACGECHSLSGGQAILAAGGFAVNEQQYSELMNSKHFALGCVTCHDPHASSVYADQEVNAIQGINVACATCHWQQVSRKVSQHSPGFVSCTACHMAPLVRSAVGDLEQSRADIASHLFSINTSPGAPQFSEDGTMVMPYLTLEYVCGSCHNGEIVNELTADEVTSAADGYHNDAAGGQED